MQNQSNNFYQTKEDGASKIKMIFRWIAVIPCALLAGIITLFPIHWLLYLKSVSGGSFLIVEVTPENLKSIELFITPFIIAICFVYFGSQVAPTHKFNTSIALAILFFVLVVGFLIYAVSAGMQPSFEFRSLGTLLGLILGVYFSWKTHTKNLKSE